MNTPQTPVVPPIPPNAPAPAGTTLPHAGKSRRRSHRLLVLVCGALVTVAAIVFAWRLHLAPVTQYVTQAPVRQTLTQTASATGTVNPQDTISVGSQVSGTILALLVDYNSRVHRGEVLARIDPSTFAAELEQARAAYAQALAQTEAARQTALAARSGISVAQSNADSATAQSAAAGENLGVARAAVLSADAVVVKTVSASALARRTLERDRTLLSSGYVAQSQFDTDQSALVAAQSAVASANVSAHQTLLQASASRSEAGASDAQRAAAERLVAQTQAQAVGSEATARAGLAGASAAQSALRQAQLNLQRAVIVSPVDGTVIARNVSVGQTVAASFQTPTLFTIAKDLTRMEVDIAVGEPDIGTVVPGAPVEFSVLAYPNDPFHGVVSQVRENPTTIQNVVTYTVVTLVDNRSGHLRPGMTATAAIRVAQVRNALVVSLPALQWRPPASAARPAPTSGAAATATTSRSNSTSPWGTTDLGATGAVIAGTTGAVYAERNGKPERIAVHVDLVSGTQAAITPIGATLGTADRVVVGTSSGAGTTGGNVTNPLLGRSAGGGAAR